MVTSVGPDALPSDGTSETPPEPGSWGKPARHSRSSLCRRMAATRAGLSAPMPHSIGQDRPPSPSRMTDVPSEAPSPPPRDAVDARGENSSLRAQACSTNDDARSSVLADVKNALEFAMEVTSGDEPEDAEKYVVSRIGLKGDRGDKLEVID